MSSWMDQSFLNELFVPVLDALIERFLVVRGRERRILLMLGCKLRKACFGAQGSLTQTITFLSLRVLLLVIGQEVQMLICGPCLVVLVKARSDSAGCLMRIFAETLLARLILNLRTGRLSM